MPEHAVKCWLEPEWDDYEVWGDEWKRTWYRDRDDLLPAIAVPLDQLERLLHEIDANGGNWYPVPHDTQVIVDHLERLCREMREEVGHG